MRGGSCPHRAIVTKDGFADGTGSFFGLLINAYSRDWTPGQQERFLELIDREFPDVTRATVVYLERCVEAGPFLLEPGDIRLVYALAHLIRQLLLRQPHRQAVDPNELPQRFIVHHRLPPPERTAVRTMFPHRHHPLVCGGARQ